MALEFKGIKANSMRLMANHAKLTKTLADAVESSDKLISHVVDFKGMADQMVDDIEFAANVLGNGSGNGSEDSEKAKEPVKPPPAVLQLDQPKIESSATPANQEAGATASETFLG